MLPTFLPYWVFTFQTRSRDARHSDAVVLLYFLVGIYTPVHSTPVSTPLAHFRAHSAFRILSPARL